MDAAGALEDLDGRALRLAGAPDALQPRAVGLDVTGTVERLGDEHVTRVRCRRPAGKKVVGRDSGWEGARTVDVNAIPKDVDLNGGIRLIDAVAEGVVECLADCVQGDLGHLPALQ